METKLSLFQVLADIERRISAIHKEMNARFTQAGLQGDTPFTAWVTEEAAEGVMSLQAPEGTSEVLRLAVRAHSLWTSLPQTLAHVDGTLTNARELGGEVHDVSIEGLARKPIDELRELVATTEIMVEPFHYYDVMELVIRTEMALARARQSYDLNLESIRGTRFWPTETVAPPEG